MCGASKVIKDIVINMESPNKFNCAECDIIFLTKFDMAKHLGSVHAGFSLISCKQCNPISWMKESSLQQHDISVHNGKNNSDLEQSVKTRLPQGKMPQGSNPKPMPAVNKPVFAPVTVNKPVYSALPKPMPTQTKPVHTIAKTRHKSVHFAISNPMPTETKPVYAPVAMNKTVFPDLSKPKPTENKPVDNIARMRHKSVHFAMSKPIPTETKPVYAPVAINKKVYHDLPKPMPTETKPAKMRHKSVHSAMSKQMITVNKPVYEPVANKPVYATVAMDKKVYPDLPKPMPTKTEPVNTIARTRHKSVPSKPPNKLALLEKLLKQQQVRELSNSISPKLSQNQNVLRKENSLINSNDTKNVNNPVSIVKSVHTKSAPEVTKSKLHKQVSFMNNTVFDESKENLSIDHPQVNGKVKDIPPRHDKIQEFNKAFGRLSNLSVSVAAVKPSPKKYSQANEKSSSAECLNLIKKIPGISFSKNGKSFTNDDMTSNKLKMDDNSIYKKVENNCNNKGRRVEINPNIKEQKDKIDKRKNEHAVKTSVPKKRKRNGVISDPKKSGRSSAKNKSLLNDSGFCSDLSDTSVDFTKVDSSKTGVSKKIFDIFKHFTGFFPEDPEKKRQREADIKFQEEFNRLWIEELKVTDLRPPPCLRPCCIYHPPTCHCPDCLQCRGACCQNAGVRAGKCCKPGTIGKCINPKAIYCYATCCYPIEERAFDKTETKSVELINPLDVLVSSDDYAWAQSVVNTVGDQEEVENRVDPFYDFKADDIFIEKGNYIIDNHDVYSDNDIITSNEGNDILHEQLSHSDIWNNDSSISGIPKNEKAEKLMDHIVDCQLCAYLLESENIFENNLEHPLEPTLNTEKSETIIVASAPSPINVISAPRISNPKIRSKSRVDSHDWQEGGLTLPSGWKICTEYRPTCDEKGKKAKDTYYLSPSQEFFRSRKKVLEHLQNNGAPEKDIELVKNGYKGESKGISHSLTEFVGNFKTSSSTLVDYDMHKDIAVASDIINQSMKNAESYDEGGDEDLDVNNGMDVFHGDSSRSEFGEDGDVDIYDEDGHMNEFIEDGAEDSYEFNEYHANLANENIDDVEGFDGDSYESEFSEDNDVDIHDEYGQRNKFKEDGAEESYGFNDDHANLANENIDDVCNIINEHFNMEIKEKNEGYLPTNIEENHQIYTSDFSLNEQDVENNMDTSENVSVLNEHCEDNLFESNSTDDEVDEGNNVPISEKNSIASEQYEKDVMDILKSESIANEEDGGSSVVISDSEQDEENCAVIVEQNHTSANTNEENINIKNRNGDDMVIVIDDMNEESAANTVERRSVGVTESTTSNEKCSLIKDDYPDNNSTNAAFEKSPNCVSKLTKAKCNNFNEPIVIDDEDEKSNNLSEPIVIDEEETGTCDIKNNKNIVLKENITNSIKQNKPNEESILAYKYSPKKRKDNEITDNLGNKKQKLDYTEFQITHNKEKENKGNSIHSRSWRTRSKSQPSSVHKESKALKVKAEAKKTSSTKILSPETTDVNINHPTSSFKLRKTGRTTKRKGNLEPIGVLTQVSSEEILDMITDVGDNVKSTKTPEVYSKISNPLFSI